MDVFMSRRSIVAALLCAALLPVGTLADAQQIYRWVDRNGRIHFTEQPPPSDARSVERVRAADNPADPASVAEMAAVSKKYPVTLYQAPPCEKPCAEARAFLSRR